MISRCNIKITTLRPGAVYFIYTDTYINRISKMTFSYFIYVGINTGMEKEDYDNLYYILQRDFQWQIV